MTNPFKANKYEIIWVIVNSTFSAALVFLGALSTGNGFSKETLCAALLAGLIVFFTQIKTYWQGQQPEYKGKCAHVKLLALL